MRKGIVVGEKRSLKQQDRLRLTYKYGIGDQQYEVELPLKLLVIGDFILRPDDAMLMDRKAINIDKVNFNEVMALHKLSLTIRVKNYLSEAEKNDMDVNLKFSSLSDFVSDSIVMQVPELIDFIKPFDSRNPTAEESDAFCKQLDAILHHPDFQRLEAAWRGLKFLVDRTDFREDIKIELLNCSKEDLLEDFGDSHEIHRSGLFEKVYTPFCEFGGEPYGAIIANYEFVGFNLQDSRLLLKLAALADMCHCPFLASAAPKFFGIDNFNELSKIKDLEKHFDMIPYIRYRSQRWQSFRELESSRYLGLTLPRFLLRSPYKNEIHSAKHLIYKEDISADHEHYLWGNAVFALASRITNSFAKYRWCSNIIGSNNGGMVEGLPIYIFEDKGTIKVVEAVEGPISDVLEVELTKQGFIPLVMRVGSDSACFFSANSVQKPKSFPDTPEGRKASLDYKLGAQLPYLFFITRFAHYIMVLYKTKIGTWRSKKDLLQDELKNWIEQYVTHQEVLSSGVYNCKTLRKAQIVIEDFDYEGYSRQFQFLLKVSPHIKCMGENFNLSLWGLFW